MSLIIIIDTISVSPPVSLSLSFILSLSIFVCVRVYLCLAERLHNAVCHSCYNYYHYQNNCLTWVHSHSMYSMILELFVLVRRFFFSGIGGDLSQRRLQLQVNHHRYHFHHYLDVIWEYACLKHMYSCPICGQRRVVLYL